jgi:hypothetical protein
LAADTSRHFFLAFFVIFFFSGYLNLLFGVFLPASRPAQLRLRLIINFW